MVVVVVTDELPFVNFFVNENLQSARNVDIKCNEHNRKCTTQQRKRKYVHMIPTETVTDHSCTVVVCHLLIAVG